jgi:hypothetical protein
MSHEITSQTVIVATKTLTLLLGGMITFLSLKAYRRTGSASLRALAVGFAIVAIGSLLGGSSWLIFDTDLLTSVAIESVVLTIGFGVVVYSLYVSED